MNTLFIAYHSASTPIMESQGFSYIRGLADKGMQYSLLTFEPAENLPDSIKLVSGIGFALKWKYLIYHKRPRLLATIYDIAYGILTTAVIIKKDRIKLVHARGFISALIAFIPAKMFQINILFDTRGLLADKYVCGGLLNKNSFTYKFMRLCEDTLIRQADAFTVETYRHAKVIIDSQFSAELSQDNGLASKISVIPCCVDTGVFNYKLFTKRAPDGLKFVFLGKVGTWYLLENMFDFFIAASKKILNSSFLFITESPATHIYSVARKKKVDESRLKIVMADRKDVPDLLSGANVSIFFMNTYKQYGFSPIKFGESLACGLPVIINSGFGDCDEIVLREKVGSVISGFSYQDYDRATQELLKLLSEGEALRERCRSVAKKYFCLEMGVEKYLSIYKELQVSRH